MAISKGLRKNLGSEKAKSEFLIAPVIAEIAERNVDSISFYSGYQFDVDKSKGLKGFCDFIISAEPEAFIISAPVLCVVEAKNENLDAGLAASQRSYRHLEPRNKSVIFPFPLF
ncbi:MAG: hypothetical protein U5L45_15655 [Saprospiraceae bacterium]|nr:hypothetical protein [Saprospiraceae bacterium]